MVSKSKQKETEKIREWYKYTLLYSIWTQYARGLQHGSSFHQLKEDKWKHEKQERSFVEYRFINVPKLPNTEDHEKLGITSWTNTLYDLCRLNSIQIPLNANYSLLGRISKTYEKYCVESQSNFSFNQITRQVSYENYDDRLEIDNVYSFQYGELKRLSILGELMFCQGVIDGGFIFEGVTGLKPYRGNIDLYHPENGINTKVRNPDFCYRIFWDNRLGHFNHILKCSDEVLEAINDPTPLKFIKR